MEGLKLFLIFFMLFLLQNGVISQDPIPSPEDLCMSEAKLERKQILTQLLELKSYLQSQFGSIRALDKRLMNIERLLTTNEARTNKQIGELGKMIKDLGSKKPQDGPKNRGHEQMWIPKSGDGKEIKISYCKINSTRSIVPNLEGPMADIQSRTEALLRESKEERVRRAEDHVEVVTHLEALHTAVDPSSAYLNYENYENSSAASRKKVLEMLLKDPKATFFRGENWTGEAVNYDSSKSVFQGGCHQMYEIKSVRISESCVRVFKKNHCHGISRALYPKPNSGSFNNFLTPELSFVRAVGPCLPNEFQLVTVSVVGSRIVVSKDKSNVRQVPDFVDFDGGDTFKSKSTSISSDINPVSRYILDQGRPKWIDAQILKRHLKSNTVAPSGMNMAIPPELGGPTNELYNTFNQTRKNFETWKRITDDVVAALKQSSIEWVKVVVTLVYDTPSASNAYGFYYWISFYREKIVYGFIEN